MIYHLINKKKKHLFCMYLFKFFLVISLIIQLVAEFQNPTVIWNLKYCKLNMYIYNIYIVIYRFVVTKILIL